MNVAKLARLRHIFSFPNSSISDNVKIHLDRRGSQLGIKVYESPLIAVSAARNWAVYSSTDLLIPQRQIGIVSLTGDDDFLKALSLYLSSDFAFYHQFFTSTELGVKRDRATLNALRAIPVPIADYTPNQLKPWVDLHSRLVKTSPIDVREIRKESSIQQILPFDAESVALVPLLKELNELVSDALGLDERERSLVHDLVHVKLELNDGKVGQPAVRPPKVDELRAYASRLKKDLDAFVEGELDKRHQVGIIYDKASASGMIQVDLIKDPVAAKERIVLAADNPTAKQLEKTRQRLRKQHRQWIYFDRNLRIYEGTKTFILKPLQRFQWTESQAMQDATEIIAETLQLGGDGT